MPRKKKPDFSKSMEEAEKAAKEAAAKTPQAPDTYLGGEPEEEVRRFEERQEEAVKAEAEGALDVAEELVKLRAEKAEMEAEIRRQKDREKMWREGKLELLDPEHPCEVTIQPGGPTDVNPVPVLHNGKRYEIPRGHPTKVPAKVVWILQDAKVDQVEKRIVDNVPMTFHRQDQRYPFTFHALSVM